MTGTLRTRATRTARWIGSADGRAALATATVVVAVELVGRRLPLEWAVAPAWLAFVALYRFLRRGADATELRWPRAFGARLRDASQRVFTQVRAASFRGGADLRGAPELPRAVPGLLLFMGTAPWLAVLMLTLAADAPQRFVAGLHERFFLLHALIVGVVWIAAVVLSCGFAVLVLGTLHDECYEPQRRRGRLRPEQEHALQVILVLVWTAFALAAPAALTVGVGLGATLAATLLLALPLGVDLSVAWHTSQRTELRTCSFLTALRLRTLCGAGLATAVVLAAHGSTAVFVDGAAAPLAFTAGLGALLAGWGAAAALVALALSVQVTVARLRARAAASAPVTLRVSALPPRAARALRGLARRGFALRRGRRRRRAGDVRIDGGELIEVGLGLETPVDVFETPPHERLRRRAVRIHRRCLLAGVRRAFLAARAQAGPRVDGFWVGPQHWFERAIWTSGPEEDGGPRCFDSDVGPPFREVLDWRTRAYFERVCGGLELDHFFVERGVDHDALRRALEMLFELEDLFGGAARAEERHFRGIPGARILIHEQPGDPRWLPAGYPEPEHDELARARILHLFRERGGEFDRNAPRSPSRTEPLVGSGR